MSSTKWVNRKLGDMVQFKTGKLNSNAASADGLYPFFTCSRETFRTDTYSFDTEAVLLAGNNASGVYPLKYFKGKFDAYQRTYVITTLDPDTITNRFLYYVLQPQLERLQTLSTGAATKFLTLTILKSLEVSIPPLHEQQRVTSILSAYDDLIENNTRRIEILEEMARRLYEEWFVHFRFPGHEEAELESVTVGDIAEVIRGRSYRSKDLVAEGGFPFVNLKCVHRDGGFRRDGLKRYDGKYKPDQVVHHGDIVMAVTDMTQERRIVARAAMVPDLEERGGIISMDLVKVSPKANIPKEFLYAALRWSDFSENVKNHANGANVLHLHPDHIRSHVMQVPPDESRLEFSRMVKPLFDLCESLEKKNTNLRAQRDLLLPKLVSGEIDVSDISMPDDKEVEAA